MSCYNNRENYNFIASRTSSGYKYFSFNDTITQPETVAFLIRNLLSEGTNSVKRRAFQMYMLLNEYTSSKPDITGDLLYEYSLIVEAIFEPFIDGYGKFNKSININDLDKSRMKIVNYLKKLTNCGEVNVIFKSYNATPLTSEIECFITDYNTSIGKEFDFKIDNSGLKLTNSATITLSIPIRFIDNKLTSAYNRCMLEFKKSNIKLESTDQKLILAIKSYINKKVTKDLYRSLICAIYKEQIFNKFAENVMIAGEELSKSKLDTIDNLKLSLVKKSTPSLNFKTITELIKKSHIIELNPHILLDMFEIYHGEMNLFFKNFVRDNDNIPVLAPNYSNLQVSDNDYLDEESKISASTIYTIKLNYCIIALMLLTVNSIKESTRSKYCMMLSNALSSIKTRTSISYITNNKEILIKELKNQTDMMNILAQDIIKLKRFSERFNIL